MRLEKFEAHEKGFTLIEVLVALVVTALLLAIIMPAALNAKARLTLARHRQDAVPLAASIIAERQASPLDLSDRSGHSGVLDWRTRESIVATDPRGFFALTRIDAEISDANGKEIFAVSTRRLKRTRRT